MRTEYRVAPYRIYQCGDRQALISLLGSGDTLLVPSTTAAILPFCEVFRPVDEHAAEIGRHWDLTESGIEQVSSVVRKLIERNVFLSDCEILPSPFAGEQAASTTPPAIRVGIPVSSMDPPKRVSTLAHHLGADRESEIVVIGPYRSDLVDSLLATDTSTSGTPLRVIQAEHIEKYRNYLSEWNISRDVLERVLPRRTPSHYVSDAYKNCLLLDSIGHKSILFEDHATWQFVRHPEKRPGVWFGNHHDPLDKWFTCAPASPVGTSIEERGLLAQLTDALGLSLPELDKSHGAIIQDEIVLADACGHLSIASRDLRTRVAISSLGFGGSGSAHPLPEFLLVRGDTRIRVIGTAETYRAARDSSEVVAIAPAKKITHPRDLRRSSCIGMDNSRYLPPFLLTTPLDARTIGALVQAIVPTSFLYHVPIGAVHACNGADATSDNGHIPGRLRLPDIFLMILESQDESYPSDDPASRTLSIALRLRHIAAMPISRFVGYIREITLSWYSRQLVTLEEHLNEFGRTPSWWYDDAKGMRLRFLSAMQNPGGWRVVELGNDDATDDVAARALQDRMTDLAEILESWPQIRMASQELNRSGVRLSSPLAERARIKVPSAGFNR